MQRQNWLITGVSTGLGRAFAQAALSAGHTVVGTVRSENDVRAFEELGPGHAHGRILDVTDGGAVNGVVAEVERSVGPLDVVVANAGYGLEGTFEETPLAEVRRQFDVNVFGAMATLQAALPHMRARRRGHLMAVTSMGGLMAVPGMSAYCGSKFALEGILEALGKEVAQFGIHVTAIEPGSFRTDWAGRSMTRAARTVADYDDLFAPIREARQKASGNQLGNPAKAGKRSYTSPRSISRRPTSFWARTRCDWSPPRVRQWMRTSERGRRCRVRPTSPGCPALMPGRPSPLGRRGIERKGDVRERAILDTCEALLADKGYDAMTVGDIAQGAGITRGPCTSTSVPSTKWSRHSWLGPSSICGNGPGSPRRRTSRARPSRRPCTARSSCGTSTVWSCARRSICR